MRIVELIILLLLIAVLAIGGYLFWLNMPGETLTYKPIQQNTQSGIAENAVSGEITQFYPNMRFAGRNISYRLESACNPEKWVDIERAFDILSEKTILSFYKTNKEPEIRIMCSEISPAAEEEGHFIAGEGGPSDIINTSNYAVILSGKIALYRAEKCQEPKIAIHEILHALGFEHYNSTKSIMYPVTGCEQEIDMEIIEGINNLYAQKPLPDLRITELAANQAGRYLNFEANISNEGLALSADSELEIYADDSKISNFSIGKIDIGVKKSLFVTNVRLPRGFDEINFVVNSGEEELSYDNNKMTLSAVA